MHMFVKRYSRKLLLILLSVVMVVSIVTGSVTPLSAVANPPICDFSQGGNGLVDFQLGRCVCDYRYYLIAEITTYSPCPEVCSLEDLSAVVLVGSDNREKIFNFFIARGLTSQQASGILGNIQTESGGTFSPTVNEFSKRFPEGGYGIAQWTGGRRTNLVNYMTKKIPELMEKYYTTAYSTNNTERTSFTGQAAGFISRNAFSGQPIPTADNDALLLAQLEFLMSETTTRTIGPRYISKLPGLTVGENEWEAVKKQTSFEGASNVWVYNFEIPANIDETAIDRAKNGESIFNLYSSNATTVDECEDELLGDTRAKVIQIAEEEFALWDSGKMGPGSDFDKYLEGNGETDWCAYFVSWVYKQAGYPVTADGTPYPRVSQFASATDRFDVHPADGSYVPVPGDIALYGYHTNLIVAVSADNPRDFTTIGGNEGGEDGEGKWNTSFVKKSSGTYWAGEAEYYVSPKG